MEKPVDPQSQEIEWHDADGWTEELGIWLLAWTEVVLERKYPEWCNIDIWSTQILLKNKPKESQWRSQGLDILEKKY